MKDFLLLVPVMLLFAQNLFYEINISPGWKIKEILDNEILTWILTTIGCYGIVLLTASDNALFFFPVKSYATPYNIKN